MVMASQMFSRILVAVDESPAALAAVHVAVDLEALSGARLRFVHVIGDGELVRALARLGRDGQTVATRSTAARGASSCLAARHQMPMPSGHWFRSRRGARVRSRYRTTGCR